LGINVLALRGSNDPDVVAVVNDCMALLIKKACGTIDEDAALGNANPPSKNASEADANCK
jgi:hypothetical protein